LAFGWRILIKEGGYYYQSNQSIKQKTNDNDNKQMIYWNKEMCLID
jgi:hypothetical protein